MMSIANLLCLALAIAVIFPRRVLRVLGLEPQRASHLFLFFAVVMVLVTLLVADQRLRVHHVVSFTTGALVGAATSHATKRRMFRDIRDGVLYLYADIWSYVGGAVGLLAGYWAVHLNYESYLFAFMMGACLVDAISIAAHAHRQEGYHGPLEVRYGRPGEE